MHDILRERLMRSLESLPEDRLYQVLDYVEFLGSKYARGGVRPADSALRRFGERLEDHMRIQGVGLNAIKGTLGIMGTADRIMTDVADAGKSLLKEVETGLKAPPPSTRSSATAAKPAQEISPPANGQNPDR